MSIKTDLAARLSDINNPAITNIEVDKGAVLHGEDAVSVKVSFEHGGSLEGKFRNTPNSRSGFGGVEFDSLYNIVGLMESKVRQYVAGGAE